MAGVGSQTNKRKNPVFKLFGKITSLENFRLLAYVKSDYEQNNCSSLSNFCIMHVRTYTWYIIPQCIKSIAIQASCSLHVVHCFTLLDDCITITLLANSNNFNFAKNCFMCDYVTNTHQSVKAPVHQ